MRKVFATWHLNRACNFRCEYCFISGGDMQRKGHDVDRVISAFKSVPFTWETIHMSGGEPFLFPKYVELCKKLTELKNVEKISINTNLSTKNVFDFADKINPEKVDSIHASLHLSQRNDFNDFAEKVSYLREKGFNIFASQVIYPPLFEKYKEAFEYFQKKRIDIEPKIFRGFYRLKHYSEAYSKKEKDTILQYKGLCKEKLRENSFRKAEYKEDFDKSFGNPSWIGSVCNAGFNYVVIQFDGDCYRCHSDSCYLGNLFAGSLKLFEKPIKCISKTCNCPVEGFMGCEEKPNYSNISLKKYWKHYGLKIGRKFLG